MGFLFLALVIVPIIEIALFIEIGGIIGTWATIGCIVATAAFGTALLRAQGAGLMARARATLNRGEMPVEEVVHGLFLLVAGVLLLTPGFFTDAVGLLLCVPPLRLALGRAVLRRIGRRMNVHVTRFRAERAEPRNGGQPPPPPAGEAPHLPGQRSRWRPPQDDPEDEKST